MSQANQADFFGEGTLAPVGQGVKSPEQIAYEEEMRKRATELASAPGVVAGINARRTPTSGSGYNPDAASAAFAGGNIGGAGGAYNTASDSGKAQYDYMHELGSPDVFQSASQVLNRMGEKVGVSHAGDTANPLASFQVIGSPTDLTRNASNPNTGLGTTAANAGKPVTNLAPEAARVSFDNPVAAAAGTALGVGDSGGDVNLDAMIRKGDQQSANARGQLAGVTANRDALAQDMFATGAAAQGRQAPQAAGVNYGPAQTVTAGQAAGVNYGAPQQVQAPTLASAQQASMGNFGAQQSVQAGQIAPFQQAQAQQASATNAANAAGFLGGTAQQARSIADLDFTQANQARGAQESSLARIGGFLDAGPGASMAQQQLRMAQEQNLGAALSLARSGRGNAAGNMKMAMSENAATNAQTNQQAALLRAQEGDMWQQRQLQGMGLETSAAQGMRQQDLGAAQAQGQQAISREQIASNVDVSRAGLEQGLAQFNAGAQNQASLTNAQLGTQASTSNANNSAQAAIQQAGYTTDANVQQAGLANARNVAMGQAGTNVSMTNAEQANLTSRQQGQMGLDANISQAGLANALAVAQGNSSTEIGVANANNTTNANMTQAELANALAVAQGNSSTDINTTNATLGVRQGEANDALQQAMTGLGNDANRQGQDALTTGITTEKDYYAEATRLAAEIAKAKAMREAGRIGGVAALVEGLA